MPAAPAPSRDLTPDPSRAGAPGADRRLHVRRTVMRDAQAFRPDGLSAAVLLLDLSEHGARLRTRGAALPDDFVLADPLTFTAYRARVVWRKDAEVGVRLLRSQGLFGAVPAALQPAKAFCESHGRQLAVRDDGRAFSSAGAPSAACGGRSR